MKIKNKALAIISTLMLCMVLVSGVFPVKVSAEDYSDLDIYYLTGGTGDWEGIKKEVVEINDIDFNKKSYYPEYSAYIVSAPPGTKEESWTILTYDLSSEISRFKIGFGIIPYNTLNTINPYYIYFCGVSNDPPYGDIPILVIQIFASNSPIRYDLIDNEYCLSSDSDIVYATTSFPISGLTDTYKEGRLNSFRHQVSSLSISTDTRYDFSKLNYPSDVEDVKNGKYFNFNGFNSALSITWDEIYSNCDIEINGFNFHNEPIKNLKNQIDVKLTPEFKIGMDRSIPNSAFNTSEDYWKLEVTNNNSCNIQFKCYVIPATGDVPYVDEWSKSDGLKSVAEGIPININTDDFIPVVPDKTVWMLEKNQWIYSKETQTQEEFQSANVYSVNKPTSCFFIKSGGTFTQLVKWNQLNLNKNQPYQFLVTACECPYDKASDIHINLASEDYDQSQKHIPTQSYYIISDFKFSVKNPLPFDSSEDYGDVIANTGRQQVDDDYWKVNAIDKNGEIEVRNDDYVNGWRLHPDGSGSPDDFDFGLDISDVGVDDVKELITYSKEYFGLIKSAMLCFPSFIWALIYFGLTALIVIAIVKALL